MYENIIFTKNVTLLPVYYDANIDQHLLDHLKDELEGKIYDGYLVIKIVGLKSKDPYRHHYIMNGITHLSVTFQCLTESLYVGETIEMTKIEDLVKHVPKII